MTRSDGAANAWPALDMPGWQETSRTLLLWSQIVGKTRLALAPPLNHWWHVTLYVSARGLTTSLMPAPAGPLEVELDLVNHQLHLRVTNGAASLPLEPGPLALFYERYFTTLHTLGVDLRIFPRAVEIPETIWLDHDHTQLAYDRAWATSFFGALLAAERVLARFRARYLGKASPVHFFWGAGDLATTRFSGRRAPTHPGGIPNCPDWVAVEAYSHEVSSAGFWAGDARFPEAAFYSYAYPEPKGFDVRARVPRSARYEPSLGEFVLPYAAVRAAQDPERELMDFLEGTYAAAAELSGWDRHALERQDAWRR